MKAEAWDGFVLSLLTLPQSVSVVLDWTLRRIPTSRHVTRDDRKRDYMGLYERLEFTTVPSQTAKKL